METGYLSKMDKSGLVDNSSLPVSFLGRVAYRFGLVIFGLLWVFLSSTLCGCGAMNGYVMNRSGKRYYDKGNYEYARYEFERALMDDPHNANYAFNVARSMEREGEYDNAEMMFQHALTLEPDHLPSYHSLASMLRAQGRTDEAQDLLVAWADTQPYSYEAQQSAANLYQQQGDMASAQRYSAQAMRNMPGGGTGGNRLTRRNRMLHASAQRSRQVYGPQPMHMSGQYPQSHMIMQGGQPGMYSPRYPHGTAPSLQMATTMPQNDPTMMGGPVVPDRTMASAPVYQQSFPQMQSQPTLTPTPAVPTPMQYQGPTLPNAEPQLLPELPAPTSHMAPQAYGTQQFVSSDIQQMPVEFQQSHSPTIQYQGTQQVMMPNQGLPAPVVTQPTEFMTPQTVPSYPIQNVSTQNNGAVVPAVQAF